MRCAINIELGLLFADQSGFFLDKFSSADDICLLEIIFQYGVYSKIKENKYVH